MTSLASVWPRVPVLVADALERVSLRATFPTDLPPVAGSGGLWVQILAGLVTNAAEASHEGAIVEVGAGVDADAPGLVRIWVEDRGRGIHESQLPHLLRASGARPIADGHTVELGLPHVAALVEGMDGTMAVSSKRGEGTRVELTVPAAGGSTRTSETMHLEGTVLVADDDRAVRTATGRILRRLGLDVIEADTGTQARHKLTVDAERYRAAVLDVVMPGTPVGDVVADVRRRRPDLPIVLVSGYDTLSLMDPVLALGGVRFLRKPYAAEDLAQTLDDLLAAAPAEALAPVA